VKLRPLAIAVLLMPALGQTPPSIAQKLGMPKFFKLKPLAKSEIDAVKARSAEPQAVGRHRPLEARAFDQGKWKNLARGASVWRLGIESPGAAGLRVHFTGFDANAGRVWIHAQMTQGKPEVVGPYSGKGPHNDGEFWSDVVFSPTIDIEYQPAAPARKPPFRIPEIAHLISR
jgi:hypothetical protein